VTCSPALVFSALLSYVRFFFAFSIIESCWERLWPRDVALCFGFFFLGGRVAILWIQCCLLDECSASYGVVGIGECVSREGGLLFAGVWSGDRSSVTYVGCKWSSLGLQEV